MATIYRDNLGVPHIDAINYADAVKVISYCHSEDDFYTIQILILVGRQKGGHYDDWDGPYLDMVCSFFDIEKMWTKIAAYCMFPKKPCINVQRTLDTQLTLF